MAQQSWILSVVVIVVLVLAGVGSAAYVYLKEKPSPSNRVQVVEGSNVTVNYIGLFGSGPEAGRIFDTSIYGIGSNPAYAKALEYHERGPAKNYTPLPVYVGGSTPSGGYTLGNLSFIQVVPGFWQGIVGMQPNTTRTVVIPPSLGYGPTDPACVLTEPLVQTLPAMQTLPGITFQKSFPGITAATGEEFSDPLYGWTDQILSANASYVTLQRLPYVGQTTELSGWPVTVTSVQGNTNGTGIITVQNELSPAQAGHLLGNDYLGTGPCSSSNNHQFIVTDVNLAAGTFTENFNPEVQGQTLIFTITVVGYWPH